jgi:hypothetical protein
MKKIILSFSLLISACAFAGNFTVDQFSIDGGGGTSSGGTFSVTGTVGQPDAGEMSGGSFGVEGGFWSLFAVELTPDAPELKITLTSSTAFLSWPIRPETYHLQTNPDIADANGWISVVQNPTTNNNILTVPVSKSPGTHYFRLKK